MPEQDKTSSNQGGDKPASPLPPVSNPAVGHAPPRRNYLLPWVLLGLAVLALLLLLTRCGHHDSDDRTTDQTTQTTTTSTATGAAVGTGAGQYQRGTIAYDVNQYLLSNARTGQRFTFANLHFDTGSDRIRDVDQSDVAQLADVLKAHPGTQAEVIGYADARGSASSNATLGGKRANAVVRALKDRGVDTGNIVARTGGESNPVGSNASAGGQAENRRTEFVLLPR